MALSSKAKKRKRSLSTTKEEDDKVGSSVDHIHTVSIALPGSIIDNAQNLELKTYLAGQISRAAGIFSVDEIIVFDEEGTMKEEVPSGKAQSSDPNVFLCRILQYMETPQYLRKSLYPMHPDLKLVGLLNPLDAPHHLRMDEDCEYREGVVLNKPVKLTGKSGSYVNCGLHKDVIIDKKIQSDVRVTVHLSYPMKPNSKHYKGVVVAPSTPRVLSNLYWGYNVRYAKSFGQVFTESTYKEGYDLIIGTSENGDSIDTLSELPPFRHLLILFGGLQGLESCLANDQNLQVNDIQLLVHYYLNTCPNQGSRTIRTEEAILISLSVLRPLIQNNTRTRKRHC